MSIPARKSKFHKGPTPDDLAGTPSCVEENSRNLKVRRGVKTTRGIRPRGAIQDLPTVDDLAGIPVSAEEAEEMSVRVKKPRHAN